MSTTLASNSPRTPSRLPEYDSQVLRSHSISPSHPTSHPLPATSPGLPTKRPRTAKMSTERASSSSDSSDQSGMADNETEAERSQQSERSAPQTTAPPKKKRTRTLTTPHQSAVLHALLAKVRCLRPRRPPPTHIPLRSPDSPRQPCERKSDAK